MKRILSFILVLALMLPLAACGGNTETPPETTVEKIKTDVAEPLSWDKINAIPIANDTMSEEELRQICLDFMRLQLTFGWTPSQQVTYKGTTNSEKTFYPGKVYGGIPYMSVHFGNIYTAADYCDPDNGVMDLSGGAETIDLFANQCSSAMFWAYARVCNSVTYRFTWGALEKNGCLRVGDYTYPETLESYSKNKTMDICASNGMSVMFEAYAQLEHADGIVNYSNAGHMRMIAEKPNVVRGADGTIDPAKSTITYLDQIANWSKGTQSNGIEYEVEGGVDVTVNFLELYNDGYLPFTVAELNKEKPVDKSETTIDCKDAAVSAAALGQYTVTSNYAISDITVSVKDADGKEVYSKTEAAYLENLVNFSVKLELLDAEGLKPYADGKHTVEISARIGTGEKPVVYTGTLNA